MVPECEEIIIAAFRREDLVRLHTLLTCYESPFGTSGELLAWEEDLAAHETLRRYLSLLLRGGTR